MAIEKMVPVSIEGALRRANKTLLKCCESGCFHIVSAAHDYEDYYSSQSLKTLRDKNVFAPLVKRGLAIAEGLGVKIELVDYEDVEYSVSIDFSGYFNEIEKIINPLTEKKAESGQMVNEYTLALSQIEHLVGLSSNFEEIFAMKYIKVRFGRLPLDSYSKLKYFEDRNFCFIAFESREDYVWGVYFVPDADAVTVDDIFKSVFFERIRVPDYLYGTAGDAKEIIIELIEKENRALSEANEELEKLKESEGAKFLKVFCKLKALDETYELRTNVAVLNNRFYVSGFIPGRRQEEFIKLVEENGVSVQVMPGKSATVRPPVRLRNNRLFRPFEMFVTMYGLPDYYGVDPTPIVAITYMLLYGIMFGDLGQGLLIALLGFILGKWKGVKLGNIMSRIGISSAVFGYFYGSVFGMEDIIKPFFRIPRVYNLLGLDQAPHDIFGISTFVLIFALGIGVFIIILSMFINIATSLKKRDYVNALLGASGFNGLILYLALIAGLGAKFGLGVEIMNPPYVICLIVLPLCGLFFKELLAHAFEEFETKLSERRINKNTVLLNAIKTYSDAVSKVDAVSGRNYIIEDLAQSRYIKTRFGRMSYESYKEIEAQNADEAAREFFFFPIENDKSGITGFYVAPAETLAEIDRYFAALGFELIKIPAHIDELLKKEVKRERAEIKEIKSDIPKKTVGTFIIEGIIELFENMLTYLTNTMSFLRVGGFVLSHAGMMLVVSILVDIAGGLGSVGGIIAMVLGNAFVIVVEGFIVGIQVLRLEFYEMFSRYYKSEGQAFRPIMVDLNFDN